MFGSEYTREQIDEALQNSNPYSIVPSRDELQHGTSMAGVAAGSAIDGGRTYTGAAPESDIVVIKLKQCKPYMRDYYLIPEDVPAYAENDIMLAVKYAESFAVAFELTRGIMREIPLWPGIWTRWLRSAAGPW